MKAKVERLSAPGLASDPVQLKVMTEIDMIAALAAHEFAKLLPDGLTTAQYGVLNRLMRLDKAETVGELAAAFMVTQPTMSSTVRRLLAKKLVLVEPDPADRRIRRIRPTPAGKALRQETIDRLTPYYTEFEETAPDINWPDILASLSHLRGFLEARAYNRACSQQRSDG